MDGRSLVLLKLLMLEASESLVLRFRERLPISMPNIENGDEAGGIVSVVSLISVESAPLRVLYPKRLNTRVLWLIGKNVASTCNDRLVPFLWRSKCIHN